MMHPTVVAVDTEPVYPSTFDEELNLLFESVTFAIPLTDHSVDPARGITLGQFKKTIHEKMCEAYECGVARSCAPMEIPM